MKSDPRYPYNTHYLLNFFCHQKEDVRKKRTKLDIFVIGRVIAILSLKGKNIFFLLENIISNKKKTIIQSIFINMINIYRLDGH